MRCLWIFCLPLVCLASCANPVDDREPSGETSQKPTATERTTKSFDASKDLTAEQARALIPQAASLTRQEFQAILETPPIDWDDLPNHSLTAVLLAIDPNQAHEQNYATRRKFHYVGSPILTPNPEQLIAAVQGGQETSYVSVIQPEYITNCTCLTRGDTASGAVAFRAEGLYSGEVNFTAQRMEDQWQIVAFDIPEYGLLTQRQPDGTWQLVSEDSLLGIEYP